MASDTNDIPVQVYQALFLKRCQKVPVRAIRQLAGDPHPEFFTTYSSPGRIGLVELFQRLYKSVFYPFKSNGGVCQGPVTCLDHDSFTILRHVLKEFSQRHRFQTSPHGQVGAFQTILTGFFQVDQDFDAQIPFIQPCQLIDYRLPVSAMLAR